MCISVTYECKYIIPKVFTCVLLIILINRCLSLVTPVIISPPSPYSLPHLLSPSFSAHPHTLFRNNSLASKSYDQFMKIIAMPYLHGLLKHNVDQMYEDKRVVELDPSQLDR